MKETNIISLGFRLCPKCGSRYHEPPALSRVDNQTLICPDCGTREALATMGVDENEQEEILASIHGCRQEF